MPIPFIKINIIIIIIHKVVQFLFIIRRDFFFYLLVLGSTDLPNSETEGIIKKKLGPFSDPPTKNLPKRK